MTEFKPDTEITPVIFRKFGPRRGGDVSAFFPAEIGTYEPHTCTCYAHVGQHGGANLGGANLGDANLGDQWVIQGSSRADGWAFFLQRLKDDDEPMIKAGCHYFTVEAAVQHWAETRGGTPLGEESFAIVRHLVELQKIRRLK